MDNESDIVIINLVSTKTNNTSRNEAKLACGVSKRLTEKKTDNDEDVDLYLLPIPYREAKTNLLFYQAANFPFPLVHYVMLNSSVVVT